MAKIVLWIAFFFGALLVVRLLNVAKAKQRGRAQVHPRSATGETMVRCDRCGVYLPRVEATTLNGRHLCGDLGCKARD